ncbi:MAG: hypothetical protein AMJ93_10915, partial [Anaerolineae bacterium SM23_84]
KGQQAKLLFCLHEWITAGSRRQELRQIDTLGRRNKLAALLFKRDRRIDLRDDLVAEGAVQVKVQFRFGQFGAVDRLSPFKGAWSIGILGTPPKSLYNRCSRAASVTTAASGPRIARPPDSPNEGCHRGIGPILSERAAGSH